MMSWTTPGEAMTVALPLPLLCCPGCEPATGHQGHVARGGARPRRAYPEGAHPRDEPLARRA
ncbi:unnamed protein product, partial [Urochloa humidicola]